jgi:hypothetical protein
MLRRPQWQGTLVWALAIVFVICLGARNSDVSSFIAADEVSVSDTPQKSLAIDTVTVDTVPVLVFTFDLDRGAAPTIGVSRGGFFLRHGKTGPPMA